LCYTAPVTEPADSDATAEPVRCGFCAIVGLPNVGKSTLLNHVLDRHLAAVSPKPQTTRDRILGVHAIELPGESPARAQIAYVDTPGAQAGRGPLRRYMRDATLAAADDADVVLVVVDASDRRARTPDGIAGAGASLDEAIARWRRKPIVVALNKIDRAAKPDLLPLIAAWSAFADGVDVVPIQATTGDGVDALERAIARRLPVGPALFPVDHVTDRPPQFVAQEIIREQLYHQLGKELPYACAVQVETWTERGDDLVIGAVIVVERASQKPIVVGRAGRQVRDLGIAARAALAEVFGRTVHLSLFVKVLEEWSRKETELRKLGYGGDQR
jgi:GTP-binding protein Era